MLEAKEWRGNTAGGADKTKSVSPVVSKKIFGYLVEHGTKLSLLRRALIDEEANGTADNYSIQGLLAEFDPVYRLFLFFMGE